MISCFTGKIALKLPSSSTVCAGKVSALTNLPDGLTHSERLLTVLVIEKKKTFTANCHHCVNRMETCVCTVCLFACVAVCFRGGIYVKVHIFGSHFLLMFKITVSRQEFFEGERERNRGETECRGKRKTEIGNFFMVLERQTLTITTPFVLMFSPSKPLVF